MIAGGGEVASHYVQPHVGGDVAFIVGVAKCLLDNNGADPLFIEQHTEGFEAYRDFAEQTQWQDIVGSQALIKKRSLKSAGSIRRLRPP